MVPIEGEAFLDVWLQGTSGVDMTSDYTPVYTGPDRVRSDTTVVTEVVEVEDFEANVHWIIGLDGRCLVHPVDVAWCATHDCQPRERGAGAAAAAPGACQPWRCPAMRAAVTVAAAHPPTSAASRAGEAAELRCPRRLPRLLELITDPMLSHAISDPIDADEPMQKAEPAELTEPMLSADPTDPMLRTEPWEAMLSIDPCDQRDHLEATTHP